jgi:two-component system NarL family response regulator
MSAANRSRRLDACSLSSCADDPDNGSAYVQGLCSEPPKALYQGSLSHTPSIADGSSGLGESNETVAKARVVPKEPVRVVVVDDHNVVREGLISLLRAVGGIEVVAEAADGIEAIAQIRKHLPNVALLDLRMPRVGGLEVIRCIRSESPQVRFIVLTTSDGDEDIYRALQAGASAYLLKDITAEEMVKTIRTVQAGNSYFPPAITQKLAERMGRRELTLREPDVLEQIVWGKSNKEIGIELQINQTTVKSHVNSLLGELHVTDRTRAVTVAIQRGIVSIEFPQKRSDCQRAVRYQSNT